MSSPYAPGADERVTEAVRRFYERSPFPGVRAPDGDGLLLLRELRRRTRPVRHVLDAGCGTGHTARAVARALPRASVTGLDICERSLSDATRATAAAEIANLRFVHGDLMSPPALGAPFDVVLCLGVLHHTADMPHVLANLAGALDDEGVLYLWVYGEHGRRRHDLNVRLLSMLAGPALPHEAGVDLAREFATRVRDGAPLRDLFDSGPVPAGADGTDGAVRNDAWVADQFLHVHETSLDMPGLLDLLSSAGLRLDRWLGIPKNPEEALGSPDLIGRFRRLAPRDQLLALDLLLQPPRYLVTAVKKADGRAER